MRAKTLHPRKSTSRCSKRVKRRRHPCNRRNTCAIAVRRVDSSRADAQGLTRVRRGGPTGAYPSATAQGRGTPRHRGGPPASGAAEGWRTGCVRAPGPAGGTWTRGRASDRAARVRRPLCSRCRCAQTRARPPGCDQRGSRGERGGGARGHIGPATRARCRPARRPTRGRGARGEGRGGQGRAAPGEEARSGRLELACVPYSQETRIMQNHPHECEQALGNGQIAGGCDFVEALQRKLPDVPLNGAGPVTIPSADVLSVSTRLAASFTRSGVMPSALPAPSSSSHFSRVHSCPATE